MLRMSVGKKKAALTVKIETVTLIGKGGQNLTRFVYYAYEIKSKIIYFS